MSDETTKIQSREFTAQVVRSLLADEERLIDHIHDAHAEADEYLSLALLRQRERDDARRILREVWVFFEHEEPGDWDNESGREILALQYTIRALCWLYKDESCLDDLKRAILE